MTSQDGIEITRRFFKAIEELKARKEIRGLSTFTNKYNINRWNLITVRDNPENSNLKPEYIAYLIDGYNISADWILLGKGDIFKAKPTFRIVQVED